MMLNKGVSIGHLIDKIRDAVELLRFARGTPSSQIHVLVAGVLGLGIGVSGLFMTMRDSSVKNVFLTWTSEGRDSSEVSLYVAGLQNFGNNCFLNVVLQALASCNSFYPYLLDMLSSVNLEIEARAEKMPLTVALVSLLKELWITREERAVLNPRKVMIAMGLYVSSFNLTRQQDAAEAFVHLLSSLEEELSDCYIPSSSLANIISLPDNLSFLMEERNDDLRRWQYQVTGPLGGTVGSMLACATCACQLSTDFNVFRCLPLSPVLNGNSTIIDGCTVADCLKQFTATELLQGYTCSHCWHNSALKYLSLRPEENEDRINIISQCFKHDCCNCKNILTHEVIQPTGSSHTFKQLFIARCPKILCLQIQRASMSAYGEFVKLKGHISFPLILDLLPFTIAANTRFIGSTDVGYRQQGLSPYLSNFDFQLKMHLAAYSSRTVALGSKVISSNNHNFQVYSSAETQQHDQQASESWSTAPLNGYMYRLASVVEHYGKPGSGHYAAYRRLKTDIDADESLAKANDQRWVYVSDCEVSHVSLETVLTVEASLLIYERIEASIGST